MDTKEIQCAKEAAYRLISVRDRSCHEIRSRLIQKGFSEVVIANVLDDLQGNNYLNDERFACQWITYRLRTKPMGVSRLRQELKEKGVASSVIDKAVEAQYPTDYPGEMALKLLKQRYTRQEGQISLEALERRMAGFLQRRGFSYTVIYKTIRQFLSDDA